MIRGIRALYFYGNIHIALGASLLVIHSFLIASESIDYSYVLFVFGATWAMYCLHRIIGLNKLNKIEAPSRFETIERNKNILYAFTFIGAVISLICYINFDRALQIQLSWVIPISIAYVVPLLPGSKRLRDLHFIKIFLIALIWTWVCVAIPIYGQIVETKFILFLIEMFCFIMAITLPFDIRDYEIDKSTGVKTIPALLGIKISKLLAVSFIVMSSLIIVCMSYQYGIKPHMAIVILVSNIITAFLIYKTNKNRTDLFYTGWLDGTIIFRALGVIFVFYLLN